jgi:TolB-like protein/DNA-binding winged helix-turn-helix (wHTH) protein/Flp pilus assembly protein TadD
MSNPANHLFEFGPFRLDAIERQLWRDGQEITLTPKAFGVLLQLVRNSSHVVTKEDFMREVWPDTIVEEKNLADNISILRQILGDSPQEERYIKTVPRRGYRFVANVNDGNLDVVVQETSRSRIVIEEEVAPQVIDVPLAAFQVQPATPLLEVKKARLKWLTPLLILASVVLVGGVLMAFSRWRSPSKSIETAPRTIAVLPFKPLVAESRDLSLELGMTDAIITRLSNIRHMTVRPTNSVMKYAGEGQDLRAVGSELGVEVMLDGRVQREGDRIRFSVQLVRTDNGATVWADRFDEKFTNIFAVQDQISERVASALALKLTGEEKQALSKRYTDNVQAYELYLKGLQHWSTFSQTGVEASINYYNEALKIDPTYALAHSGLATSYIVIGIHGPQSPDEVMPKAQQAIRKALELDPDLTEAHVASGAVKIFYERDWPGAERALKRGMELNPNYADAYVLYGYYLQANGKFEDAVISIRRAKELAPQWHIPQYDFPESFFFARRYDEAVEQTRHWLQLEPDNAYAYYVLGKALTQKGLYKEAAAEFQRGINFPEIGEHMTGRLMSELAHTYALSGQRDKVTRLVEQLRGTPDPWRPMQFAKIYSGLGDKDQAFHWLTKAADEQFPFAWTFKIEPHFDNLRSDPRYAALLARLKLPA